MFKLLAQKTGRDLSKLISRQAQQLRSVHVTTPTCLKRINVTEDKKKNLVTIEAEYIEPTDKFGKTLKLASNEKELEAQGTRPCVLCELEKKDIFVQHTDVLIIKQFLKEDGTVLGRKITGLCTKQQKKMIVIAKHARNAGLTLNLQANLLNGSKPSVDPRARPEHQKWNTYYDNYEIMKKEHKYL